MNIYKNKPDEKENNQRKICSIAQPQDTGECSGCPYAGVGFICWDRDGSCIKTQVKKINSRSRR